jgi:hypothetical protein
MARPFLLWLSQSFLAKMPSHPMNGRRLTAALNNRGRFLSAGFVGLLSLTVVSGDLSAAEWEAGNGFRSQALVVPATGKSGFTGLLPAETGIVFTNHLADASAANNRILENGSGVALGDVDGDGWCDIYFCRLEGDNALYRNLGNWRFEDVTKSSGVACAGQYSTGAVLADIDGDGDLDLLVNAIGGGTRSFLNDGHGHFSEITDTRLVWRFGSTSMALADIDGDGDLDLYVTNYRSTNFKDNPPGLKVEAQMVNGKIVVTPEDRFIPLMPRAGGMKVIEKGERDFLYLNTGRGRFAPVSWTSGSFLDENGQTLSAPPTDWGLSVMFRDLNGDRTPDIYVCNDFFYWHDRIWMNEDSQRFRAIAPTALRNMSLASMAVDVADINRDGYDDIFVADMLSRHHSFRHRQRPNMMKEFVTQPVGDPKFRPEVARNTLFLNRGDDTYAEIAQLSGVEATEWSWGAVFLDVDLDGYEDLLIPTGNNHDVQDADVLKELSTLREQPTSDNRLKNLLKFPRLETPKLAFRNRGDLTFEDVSAAWGFNEVGISQGMALADLDNDGDLDVVVNNLNAAAGIYRNDSRAPRVAVRLKGNPPNTRGIGAKIKVYDGAVPVQSQEMMCGGRYVSSDDPMRVFAAGSVSNELRIEVVWRSGKHSIVTGVRANRLYEIDEAAASAASASPAKPSTVEPFFQDVSELIHHVHDDEPFDDFLRQPLLPRKLSQLGPGVGWHDLDGDGWDELIIGAGRGGTAAIFRNTGKGGFARMTDPSITQPVTRDQTAIAGWEYKGQAVLLVGSANYEDGLASGSCVHQYEPGTKSAKAVLPAYESSVGPIVVGDIDGDGDLDVFLGGRVVPGKYPTPPTSQLYRNVGEKLEPDETNNLLLQQAGLVSGAVFSDLDNDGNPELILACEWGPVRVFENHGGKLTEVTQKLGLASYTGWWNGVTTGDLDNDGRLDIIAGNWGRNTKYQRYLQKPLRVFYGDFDGNGVADLIEAYFAPEVNKVVPWSPLDVMSKAIPFVAERFNTHRAFGNASVEEILGDTFNAGRELQVNTLDSMVFLNRGGRFEAKPMPVEAQFAPAFGVCVGDYDGDGNEDVFLSQNFFCVEVESARYDGGRGLWLKGDGRGGLRPVSGQESGVKIYGEQRGAALCDYDGDGRVDLAVAQNRGETKLYRNVRAKRGLRVRLRGPTANPRGVGAVIRLRAGDVLGPAREIHGGSGYWSQDSAVQVLGISSPPTHIQVRWPGGKMTTVNVPRNACEVAIDEGGNVKMLR